MSSYRHVLLYDGVCVLCNRLNAFVIPRDTKGIFAFASLQSRFGKALLEKYKRNAGDLNTFYRVADYETPAQRLLSKAGAGLFVLNELGGLWRTAQLFRIIPLPLLNALYDWLANNRYRFFGHYERCLLPKAEWKERFIDVTEP